MISIHASLRGYNLPKRGWFKPCVYCEAITSHTIDINDKYKVYICHECKKKKTKNEINFDFKNYNRSLMYKNLFNNAIN